MNKQLQLFTLLFLFVCFGKVSAQNAIYVNVGNTAAPVKDGTSWENAFVSLQEGIDAAAVSGKEIRVAKGTYYPVEKFDIGAVTGDTRTSTFVLESGVTILGGYSVDTPTAGDTGATRDYVKHETILSGDIGVLGVDADNAYQVVMVKSGTDNVTLDGFTIAKGYANGDVTKTRTHNSNPHQLFYGAGIFLTNSSGTFKNLIIRDNKVSSATVTTFGGGFYCNAIDKTVTIENVKFENNTATTSSNANRYGGAIFTGGTVNLNRVLFKGNTATTAGTGNAQGGALYIPNSDAATVTISNGVFYDNSAKDGGAIHSKVHSSGSSVLSIINSTFYNNIATDAGGGIHLTGSNRIKINIYNSIFQGNIVLNALQANQESSDVNNMAATIKDYKNTIFQTSVKTGDKLVVTTDIGSVFASTNTASPNFLRLKEDNSNLAINRGDILLLTQGTTHDYANNPRVIGKLDIGAYEIQDPTLPVELSSFTAKGSNQGVQLNWSTSSELNNAYFQVLRKSAAETEFAAIGGKIRGAGTTNTPQKYQFLDTKPAAGINYYKLSQADLDGKFDESNVVYAYGNLVNSSTKVAYAKNKLLVTFETAKATVAKLNVVDISGKTVFSTSAAAVAGSNTVTNNLNLTPGVYVLKLAVAAEQSATKFVVN